MLLEGKSSTTVKLLDAIDIDRVDLGSVVGEESSQRTTNDFRTVDDGDDSSVEAVTVGKDHVVDSNVLHDLDNSQGGARENALFGVGVVQEADVVVHVVNVLVVETLNILAHIDDVLKVLVLAISKDRVVDHDTMDILILIGLHDLDLQLVSGALPQLKLDAGLLASLGCPLGILYGGGVVVCKEPNELWVDLALSDGFLELVSVRGRDGLGQDNFAGHGGESG